VPKWMTLRNAPIWLPLLSSLRDFLAFQYIFSFEPGITEHAVRVGYTWMLPGSLVGGGFVAVGSNLLLALVVGLVCRWFADRRTRNVG
jgi:hypothetical protein